jgi:hypothetical protein
LVVMLAIRENGHLVEVFEPRRGMWTKRFSIIAV